MDNGNKRLLFFSIDDVMITSKMKAQNIIKKCSVDNTIQMKCCVQGEIG